MWHGSSWVGGVTCEELEEAYLSIGVKLKPITAAKCVGSFDLECPVLDSLPEPLRSSLEDQHEH